MRISALARRAAASAVVAGGLAIVQAGSAFACWEWCGEDPPLTINTVNGPVTVSVWDYARGPQYLPNVHQAQLSYTTETIRLDGDRTATLVRIEDTIPSHGSKFETRALVSYQGRQLAAVDGHSGQPIRLTFILPNA